MAVSLEAAEMPRRSKLGIVLIALALALAVALLIAQAKAIVGEPSAAARPDTTLRSDVAIHPGAHRGQVRVAPSGGSDVNEASTHGPTQRPKWGSDA